MAFNDALQDTVTISTISLSTDAFGQESKVEVVLYSAVPCRLNQNSNGNNIDDDLGASEQFTEKWIMQMEAQYNGAVRGDKAVINSTIYEITKKHEIRGTSATVNHVVYFLKEQE